MECMAFRNRGQATTEWLNGASDRYNFRGRTALQIAREDHRYSIERLILKAQGLTWISPYVFSADVVAHIG